ncbi:MAG TPA: hypothetical protein VNX26_10230 [Candidatus Acidoferrum sp.]|jgi:hypothetical protein|nr:hypothetical protein [Candidatus Acidoferrum sp.]
MNPSPMTSAVFFVLLTGTIAAGEQPVYQQGTITQSFSGPHKHYGLKGPAASYYEINRCGDFQTGQPVDYRVEDTKIYIRREGGKDYKCTIEAWGGVSPDNAAAAPVYQQGTIMGYDIRRDTSVFGGGGGNGAPASPVQTMTRRAKVYELKGAGLVYKVDYCGAFQAGKFGVGQTVDYRVDGERLYIRHDEGKEYSCKIEGTRAAESAKPDAPATKP